MQKVYQQTLGGRDFHLFEAVHLGLRLPLVMPFLDVVSLSVMGPRRMKNREELRRERERVEAVGGDTEGIVMEWDSKVDSFDRRLELWRCMARRERGYAADFGGDSQRIVLRILLEVLCALPADLPVHEAGVLDGDACVQRGLRCVVARPTRNTLECAFWRTCGTCRQLTATRCCGSHGCGMFGGPS